MGIGVHGKRAKAQAEFLVIGVGQALVAHVDHLVPEQRVADLGKLLIGQLREVHATDLHAHRGRQRQGLDVGVLGGVVVKLAGRM